MQVGTRNEADVVVVDDLRIVADETRIGVSLIGRMADEAVVISDIGAHTEVHVVIHHLSLSPLLKLYDNYVILTLLIGADDDEVYAFGGLGYIVFDGYLDFIVNIPVIHDVTHELHGVVPGFELSVLTGVESPLPDKIENLGSDDACPYILDELTFIGVIDDHNSYSSLYFFALPLAFSTGYFSAFRCSFSSMISFMSRPYLSAIWKA